MKQQANCPCGNSATYADCCEVLHQRKSKAETAEQLMRSRYSAFVKSEFDYLIDTHVSQANDRQTELRHLANSNNECKWLGLDILSTTEGTANDNTGVVHFVATYFQAGSVCTLNEHSRFKNKNGSWLYCDGDVEQTTPVSQTLNGACFCGSGKKFKRCHGA